VIAELVSRLIASGTPPELAAQVVAEAFTSGVLSADIPQTKADISADRRREKDRERKREIRRQSAEICGNPQKALTYKSNIKEEKKVRARKAPLSADWKPNEGHYSKASELKIPKAAVDAKAEDMRIWAGSTGALKLDWDLTFHGFLRRDAPKLAVRGSQSAATIGPKSPSWNAWKAHYRDTGKNFNAGHMDKCASDGKAFTVPSEWPPGHKHEAA